MEYWHQSYKHWIEIELFSFDWFFNIAVLLILYVLWIKLVDKKQITKLLLFGSLVAVCSAFIDIVAVTMGLWEYKVRLFPISPAPFPFDFTVIPILYMLVLQYTKTWRNYLIGSVLASGVFSFVISPIYAILGIKEYHKFNHFYIFILLLVVTTIIKAIYNWILNIEKKNSVKQLKH
jgi:hypothetical protein